MVKNLIQALALVLCLFAVETSAHAITVNGETFNEVLTLDTSNRLGYWVSMKKFYTYDNVHNSPVGVDNVLFSDPALNGFTVDEFYAMGTSTSKRFDSNINTGVVRLLDDKGDKLLEATYASNGKIDSTRIKGNHGQLNITGLFNIQGGIFSDLGILTGPIYVEIKYDTVAAIGRNDLHAANGTVHFYAKDVGGTEVPEPGTVALLVSGLLGAGRARKKKTA